MSRTIYQGKLSKALGFVNNNLFDSIIDSNYVKKLDRFLEHKRISFVFLKFSVQQTLEKFACIQKSQIQTQGLFDIDFEVGKW